MEFKFAVNDVFRQPVIQIGPSLLPPGFTGDRRAFWDTVGKVSEVVNAMGEASAAAQGLTKPITTAERLRNSEHNLYLLIDQNAANGRGAVTGMLKTGKKGLYVFDRNGQHFQVSPPCVLDFYIHESRQRTGLGKHLFEHMLQAESIEPVRMAIDRPSEKFLGFLNKHYSLNNPVKQMNNYVVFDGFFPSTSEKNGTVELDHSGSSPGKKQSANGLQTTSFASPLGRYGAPRPPCSMGQIIHNQTSTIPKSTEPTGVVGVRSTPENNYQNVAWASPENITQSAPNVHYRSQQSKMKLDGLSDKSAQYTSYDQTQIQDVQYMENPPQNSVSNPTNLKQETLQPTPVTSYLQQSDGRTIHAAPQQRVGGPSQQIQQQVFQPNVQYAYAPSNNRQSMMSYQHQNNEQMMQQNIPTQSVPAVNMPHYYEAAMTNQEQPNPTVDGGFLPQTNMQNMQYSANTTQSVLAAPQQPVSRPPQQYQNQVSQPNVQYAYTPSNNREPISYQQQNIPPNVATPTQYNPVSQSVPAINTPPYYEAAVTNQQPSGFLPQNMQYSANTTQSVPNINTPSYYNPTMTTQQPQNAVSTESVPQPQPAIQNTQNLQPQYQQQNLVQSAQSHPTINQNQIVQHLSKEIPSQHNATINQHHSHSAMNQNQIVQAHVANEIPTQPSATMNQHQIGQAHLANEIPTRPNATMNQHHSHPTINQNQIGRAHLAQEIASQPNATMNQHHPHLPMNQNQIAQAHVAQAFTHQPSTTMNQYNTNQNMKASSIYTLPHQPSQMQYQTINPQVPQHIEGNQLNKTNERIENAPAYNANGGTQVEEEKVSPSPKLERPRSLSIQLSEEQTEDKKNDVESEVPPNETEVEEIIEKLEISENGNAIDENLPATENKTPGKRTPSHLTEQGFFDLKFYHNKLW